MLIVVLSSQCQPLDQYIVIRLWPGWDLHVVAVPLHTVCTSYAPDKFKLDLTCILLLPALGPLLVSSKKHGAVRHPNNSAQRIQGTT